MRDSRNGLGTGRVDGPPTLSASEVEEIDRLCDRLEAAWRSGEHPRLEDHLHGEGRFRSALKAELMAVELEWRRRREGASSLESPRGRHGGKALPGAKSKAEPIDVRALAPGVLETLAATIGPVPHVLLRDTDGGPEPPLLRPNPGADAGLRYRIDGEIARGGMGAVLKGRDPDLGRDVALKVLREDLRDNADMVRRFVEEIADRRPVAASGHRADLRAGHFRRPPALLQHEAGQGPHAGPACSAAASTRPTTCPASCRSSRRSPRRSPTPTPGA